jgi:hypothetical protein
VKPLIAEEEKQILDKPDQKAKLNMTCKFSPRDSVSPFREREPLSANKKSEGGSRQRKIEIELL